MSGIHRDVYLYATPKTYISNHIITDNFDEPYTSASVKVQINAANPGAQAVSKKARVRLIAPDGKQLAETVANLDFAAGDTATVAYATLPVVDNLQAWHNRGNGLCHQAWLPQGGVHKRTNICQWCAHLL